MSRLTAEETAFRACSSHPPLDRAAFAYGFLVALIMGDRRADGLVSDAEIEDTVKGLNRAISSGNEATIR